MAIKEHTFKNSFIKKKKYKKIAYLLYKVKLCSHVSWIQLESIQNRHAKKYKELKVKDIYEK